MELLLLLVGACVAYLVSLLTILVVVSVVRDLCLPFVRAYRWFTR